MTVHPSAPPARHEVTAVLVAHDGARWLPEALGALDQQTRVPEQTVAVDTGSRDATPRLLARAFGDEAVVTLGREAGFGAAVQAGLDTVASDGTSAGGRTAWIWLLHDDCAPEPAALQFLLERAEQSPSAGVIGPKCRSWDGRYVTEVGVTTDGSGHRYTGIDSEEIDQGQHDGVQDVLAVGSAGALIRRDVWDDLGGFDPALPLLRDDLDFGWRATLSGTRVVAAPEAIVRHVAAIGLGARPLDALGGPVRRVSRQHALYTVLANVGAVSLPLVAVRLAIGVALRSLGLLLVRRPGEAFDEGAAFCGVVAATRQLRVARARRRRLRNAPAAVRPLLAGPAVRLRVARERWTRAAGPGGARISRPGTRRSALESGPVAEETEDLDVSGSGLLRWVATRPGVLLTAVLVVVAFVAERSLLIGTLHGGRLLPAPAGASDLWSAYLSAWHPVGPGSAAVAPPYLVPLALLSSVLGGKPWLAVDLLVLGAVPLAGLSAYLSLGRMVRSAPLRCWAAGTYALLPVLTGAVAGGRLGVCVATVLVPPVLAGGARVLRNDPRHSGWSAAFGTGLALALAVAFAPQLYLLAGMLLVGGAVAVLLLSSAASMGVGRRLAAALIVLVVPAAVLLPWTLRLFTAPATLAAGFGVLPSAPDRPVGGAALLFAWPGGAGMPPWWLFAPLAVGALAGVIRRRRRRHALAGCWIAGGGLVAAVVLSRLVVAVPGHDAVRPWPGIATALVGAGLLVASLVGAEAAVPRLRRMSFGWQQPVAAATLALAALVPVAAGVTWLVRSADGPITTGGARVVPAFVRASMDAPARPRVLVLRPSADESVHYALLRDPNDPSIGQRQLAPAPDQRSALSRTVQHLVSGSGSGAAGQLSTYAVRWVIVAPSPARHQLAARLDRAQGLTRSPTRAAALWTVLPRGSHLSLLSRPPAQTATNGLTPTARSGRTGKPLPSTPAGASTRIRPAGHPRVVALAEARSDGWVATLSGQQLHRVAVDSWAQGFRVPAGAGGRLKIHHDPGSRTAWLWAELALTALCVFAAVPATRRGNGIPPVAAPGRPVQREAPAPPAPVAGNALQRLRGSPAGRTR
jgi:GT2 family glycosyltransferase